MLNHLKAGTNGSDLLDAVTIQETHFYRNLPQVDALRSEVLPGMVSRAAQLRTSTHHLVGWMLNRRRAVHASP